MDTNKTFLFIRKSMGIGGIETYIYSTVKKLRRNGNRILWVFPEGGHIDKGFQDELLNDDVEIISINFDKKNWIKDLEINFEENEEVVALAFSLFDFVFLEVIKRKYANVNINNFFWVPHFEGKNIFIEKFAPKLIQPILNKYIRNIIISMERNDNIIYVNKSHVDAFKNTYNYSVHDEGRKLLASFNREVPEYNNDLAIKRSERNPFNIISVGRFSLPHKAYILGLIRTYGALKIKYPQLKLTIIGYGEDENIVMDEISKLPNNAKKDLKVIGKVPYSELNKHFGNANLNIGVASTIIEGALTGLISIPVRHYSESCEGYGFLPLDKKYITSSEPGEPIETFIEKVINMDEDEYLNLCKKSYDTYSNESDGTERLMNMKNRDSKVILKNSSIISIILAYRLAKFIKNLK